MGELPAKGVNPIPPPLAFLPSDIFNLFTSLQLFFLHNLKLNLQKLLHLIQYFIHASHIAKNKINTYFGM